MAGAEGTRTDREEAASTTLADLGIEPNRPAILLYILLAVVGLYMLVAVDKPRLGAHASPFDLARAALPAFGEYMQIAALIGLGLGYYSVVSVFVYWPIRVWANETGASLSPPAAKLVHLVTLALAFALAFGTYVVGSFVVIGFEALAESIR